MGTRKIAARKIAPVPNHNPGGGEGNLLGGNLLEAIFRSPNICRQGNLFSYLFQLMKLHNKKTGKVKYGSIDFDSKVMVANLETATGGVL